MDKARIEEILNEIASGKVSPADALEKLRLLPYEDMGFAKLDLHRQLRQGQAEVIFCPGKTPDQILAICKRLNEHHALVLASRATPEVAKFVLDKLPQASYHELAAMIVVGALPQPDEMLPTVAIITAGTADLPVAEEAALVLQAASMPLIRLNDVGVAGIHRLLGNVELIEKADITIVVAGMDGALPSVVAGLLRNPVIAVPTSVGYGASFDGLAALLTMLNSCAAGLTVVNIDNGFGAATAALKIANALTAARKHAASGSTV